MFFVYWLKDNERLVVFRLGRLLRVYRLGLIIILPFIDRGIKINLDESIPGWQGLSEDEIEERIYRMPLLGVKRSIEYRETTETRGVKHLSKRGRIAFLICAVLSGCSGIILLSLGLMGHYSEKPVVTTSETTAIVSDKNVHTIGDRHVGYSRSYYIYLDFKYSNLTKERIDFLSQRPQGISVREKAAFDDFHIGQIVTVIYRDPKSIDEKLCIESVDGNYAINAKGDVTTVATVEGLPGFFIFLSPFLLVIAGLALVGYYYDTINEYITLGKFPFGPVGRHYLSKLKLFLIALGLSLVTIFFAGFIPSIMIVIGATSSNWPLIMIGCFVFIVLFYLIGRWHRVGLWNAWQELFSSQGR